MAEQHPRGVSSFLPLFLSLSLLLFLLLKCFSAYDCFFFLGFFFLDVLFVIHFENDG